MINEGKRFEQDFTKSCNFFTYRLKDTAGWQKSEQTRFSSSNLCDMIAFKDSRMLLIELKSCGGTSMPYDNIKQLESMNKVSYDGVYPIFILNFRCVDRTYVLKASKLMELRETMGKNSINHLDAALHGVLIPQNKKRTRWSYDLSNL